ncbi:centrosomal protein of 19 kDa [Aplysia californica]|uniref:Centrosomal protein of 19 kDa n=1 Tax=Aplysia californica TaxID=6500 RepID=A0ABM0JRB8_APLCA|nr:centrosomal protein of 19 kDa [Aplysia californica]XP_005099720.1 centrosomal protein of 19 kDa [Aplysia californica]
MADSVQLMKCGVRFQPPALVLSYKDWKTGKLRRRSMPLRNFSKNSSIDRTVEDLKASPRHARFVRLLSTAQLQRLLTIIKDKLSGLSVEASVARNNAMDTLNPEENLNKVDEETLQRKKLQMDTSFEKHRKRPGDPDFQYNVEVDFDAAVVETSGWDSDGSEVDF